MNTIDVYFKGLFVWGEKEKEGKWGSKNHIFLFLCLVGFGIFHLGSYILYSLNPVKNWKENVWFDLDWSRCASWSIKLRFFNFDQWSIFLNRSKSKFSRLILKRLFFFFWLIKNSFSILSLFISPPFPLPTK